MIRYIHADSFGAAVYGYFRYRVRAAACFFSGPRIGHDWHGESSMYQECPCGKTYLANW